MFISQTRVWLKFMVWPALFIYFIKKTVIWEWKWNVGGWGWDRTYQTYQMKFHPVLSSVVWTARSMDWSVSKTIQSQRSVLTFGFKQIDKNTGQTKIRTDHWTGRWEQTCKRNKPLRLGEIFFKPAERNKDGTRGRKEKEKSRNKIQVEKERRNKWQRYSKVCCWFTSYNCVTKSMLSKAVMNSAWTP